MIDCSADDHRYMAEALQLARRGRYTTFPNPRVGCLLVKAGRVVGRGWHIKAGEGHAEVNAIREAGEAARGATAYVTLEPCSHFGRTPPCCQGLIDAGVTRVVAAMQDPNPAVSGRGLQALREAGIEVSCGLLESEARALNPGFISRMERNRPWLVSKIAMSLDGRTAMASGESQWITGPQARRDVQKLRAGSSAIISGVDTVVQDQASLTVRAEQLDLPNAEQIAQRQPLRVVLDSSLRLPADANILQQPGSTLVVFAVADQTRQQALRDAGAELLALPNAEGRIDLSALMAELAQRDCNEVLLEAGATLNGAFWQAGLVDQLITYIAPTLLGSDARPMLALPLHEMAQQQRLTIAGVTAVGDDWRVEAYPAVATGEQ